MTSPRDRWTPEQAKAWYAGEPWPVGCNFIPSTAVNQLEMWQAGTFDPETIERELGWAQRFGFNAARVFLHDLLWKADPVGIVSRMGRFLDICERKGTRVLFVLFDGVWDPHPKLGTQPAPRPHLHNPGWVQSPGAAVLADAGLHDKLHGYVAGVIEAFRDDERVLGWDLFNEPDNPNPAYISGEIANKAEMAAALLRRAFVWAREAAPSQPITAGVWSGAVDDRASEVTRVLLAESDVISFHSYLDAERVEARIHELEMHGRPILMTEFMSRTSGSTFESILPIVKEHKVGAFCWGLVSGKTQTVYPWDSWTRSYAAEPEPWFHDVFRPDGTPYSRDEADFVRRIAGAG